VTFDKQVELLMRIVLFGSSAIYEIAIRTANAIFE
jgi:hypothetical protein